jgi:hypothetical protein
VLVDAGPHTSQGLELVPSQLYAGPLLAAVLPQIHLLSRKDCAPAKAGGFILGGEAVLLLQFAEKQQTLTTLLLRVLSG